MINARIETVLEKTYKTAVEKRRCLIPADGIYEWKEVGKTKIPYRITIQGGKLFAMAGLWESWKSPTGEVIDSFTIITQEPNKLYREFHKRMAVILLPEQESVWLSEDISPAEALQMIIPYPDEEMQAYRVSDRVGNVKINDPGLIEPVGDEPVQGDLFS